MRLDPYVFSREKIVYQFLNDKNFFVINVTKLWMLLQIYLIAFAKMIPTLCFIQLYENQ